jgi:hypothetical protein
MSLTSPSVGCPDRLDVSPAQDLTGDSKRGYIAEAELHERHVVVDGLGDPDYGLCEPAPFDLLLDSMGATLCPVAADAEQDVDFARLHEVHHDRRLLCAS